MPPIKPDLRAFVYTFLLAFAILSHSTQTRMLRNVVIENTKKKELNKKERKKRETETESCRSIFDDSIGRIDAEITDD